MPAQVTEQLKLRLPHDLAMALTTEVEKKNMGKTKGRTNRQDVVTEYIRAGLSGPTGTLEESLIGATLVAIHRATTLQAQQAALRSAMGLLGYEQHASHWDAVCELWEQVQAAPQDERLQVALALHLPYMHRPLTRAEWDRYPYPVGAAYRAWFVDWVHMQRPVLGDGTYEDDAPGVMAWVRARDMLHQGSPGLAYELALEHFTSWCQRGLLAPPDQLCTHLATKPQAYHPVLAGVAVALGRPFRAVLTGYDRLEARVFADINTPSVTPQEPPSPMTRQETMTSLRPHLLKDLHLQDDVEALLVLADFLLARASDPWSPSAKLDANKAGCIRWMLRGAGVPDTDPRVVSLWQRLDAVTSHALETYAAARAAKQRAELTERIAAATANGDARHAADAIRDLARHDAAEAARIVEREARECDDTETGVYAEYDADGLACDDDGDPCIK